MEADAHQARVGGPEEAPRLTPAAAAELSAVRGLAAVLDDAFTIPGTRRRVGLDAVFGLFPGVGDLGSAAVGGYILLAASRLGVPATVLWRMLLNQAIDTAVGAVPLAGDVFDAVFKSNARNARLLLRAVADPAGTRRASRAVLWAVGLGFVAVTAAGVLSTALLVVWLLR